MATTSQVKSGLDSISDLISTIRKECGVGVSKIAWSAGQLAAIPANYADVISTIDSYSSDDAAKAVYKAEKALLAAEFTALKAEVDAALLELQAHDF